VLTSYYYCSCRKASATDTEVETMRWESSGEGGGWKRFLWAG
jgi:hypothetical protein